MNTKSQEVEPKTTEVRKCLFFHDWSNWRIVNENRGSIKGWPVVIVEQSRKCQTCGFTEVNLQKRDSSKITNIND